MIIGKMEEIDKRFRFYQKSIFFSDLAMDQYERNSRKLNHDQAHSGSSLNNRQDLMNNSINKTSSTKPAKTMASIGNNTITFYSPKVLNRPMTVAPTQLVEPKTQFIENVKSSTKNADTYLGRLLKSENSKKFTPKPLLGRNPSLDSHLVNETFAKQSFENIKIKQHVFKYVGLLVYLQRGYTNGFLIYLVFILEKSNSMIPIFTEVASASFYENSREHYT